MRHSTHCKFCKAPITVTVDEDYSKTGDAFRLLRLASCNRCADLRETRRKMEYSIGKACHTIFLCGKMSDETKARHREGLTKLTKRYAEMIARFDLKEGCCWDEGIVDALLDNPRQWGEVLSRLWRLYREWQQSQVGNTGELPI